MSMPENYRSLVKRLRIDLKLISQIRDEARIYLSQQPRSYEALIKHLKTLFELKFDNDFAEDEDPIEILTEFILEESDVTQLFSVPSHS